MSNQRSEAEQARLGRGKSEKEHHLHRQGVTVKEVTSLVSNSEAIRAISISGLYSGLNVHSRCSIFINKPDSLSIRESCEEARPQIIHGKR